jgi:hypothetical protein
LTAYASPLTEVLPTSCNDGFILSEKWGREMVFGASFREESSEKRQKTSRWGKLTKKKKEVDNTLDNYARPLSHAGLLFSTGQLSRP